MGFCYWELSRILLSVLSYISVQENQSNCWKSDLKSPCKLKL